MTESRFPAPPSKPYTPLRHVRVLYADDVPELRDVMRLMLSRDGHGVECVPDGQVALQRVTADPSFDLVITDHHMPLMNGVEFVHGLRALGFRGKIMVFSSDLCPAVAQEYRRLGVDRILYKPVYPSVLREIIDQLFSPLPVGGAARPWP